MAIKSVVLAISLLAVSLAPRNQQNKADQAKQGEQPAPVTAPLMVPEQVDSPSLKPKPAEEKQRDNPIIVSVVSSPKKDWYDKASVWINGSLVLIGIGGIVVAVGTLKKIERQTKATEEAARVAKSNMTALIGKERARVRVDKPSKSLDFLRPDYVRPEKGPLSPFESGIHDIPIPVFNIGGAIAHDFKMLVTINVTAVQDAIGTQATEEIATIPHLLPSKDPYTPVASFYGGFTKAQIDAIHAGECILYVSGKVTYTDAFYTDKKRETGFSFMWRPDYEWYKSPATRSISDDYSDWLPYPPSANYTT